MKVHRANRFLWLSASAMTLIGLVGCGGEKKPEGFPPLYPVTLHVTQEGKPLEGASVTLAAPDGSLPWVVGGTTDADGKVKLKTQGKYDGAPAGKYNVQISKVVREGYEEYMAAVNRNDTAVASKIDVKVFQCVEDAYTSAKETPVHVEITKESKVFDIDAGPAVQIQKPFMK